MFIINEDQRCITMRNMAKIDNRCCICHEETDEYREIPTSLKDPVLNTTSMGVMISYPTIKRICPSCDFLLKPFPKTWVRKLFKRMCRTPPSEPFPPSEFIEKCWVCHEPSDQDNLFLVVIDALEVKCALCEGCKLRILLKQITTGAWLS